jgi:hypothetical protein
VSRKRNLPDTLKEGRKMKVTRLMGVTSLVVCGYLGWAAPVGADAVTDWNAITLQAAFANTLPGPPPFWTLHSFKRPCTTACRRSNDASSRTT